MVIWLCCIRDTCYMVVLEQRYHVIWLYQNRDIMVIWLYWNRDNMLYDTFKIEISWLYGCVVLEITCYMILSKQRYMLYGYTVVLKQRYHGYMVVLAYRYHGYMVVTEVTFEYYFTLSHQCISNQISDNNTVCSFILIDQCENLNCLYQTCSCSFFRSSLKGPLNDCFVLL